MNTKLVWSSCLLTFVVFAVTVPATAGIILYSNLSMGGDVYNCCAGWTVSGAGAFGTSFTAANEFQVVNSGTVTDISLGVGYVSGINSLYVAVDSDNAGLPGAQLAYFGNLSSSQSFGGCCGLIDINGITGLHLTTGTNYWIVIGPMNSGATTWEEWNLNNTGALGTDLYSTDGGQSWSSNGLQAVGALAIIGNPVGTTPEPGSMLLLGSGWVATFGAGPMVRSLRSRRKDGANHRFRR